MATIIERTNNTFNKLRHKYLDGFVFIHINKTGGSSVQKALDIPFEHDTALEKIACMGLKRWEKKYSFAVVRNPWDKVVSHYHYRVLTNQTGLGANTIGFNQWVKRTYGEQDPTFYNNPKMFMPNIGWIADEQNNILVNKVIRFENLDTEFDEVCGELRLSVELPHVKKSKHNHYSRYYDQDTIQIVSEWFKSDIDAFGYQFESIG